MKYLKYFWTIPILWVFLINLMVCGTMTMQEYSRNIGWLYGIVCLFGVLGVIYLTIQDVHNKEKIEVLEKELVQLHEKENSK